MVYLWHMYGAHTVCRPKVTMFAVEMWFGVGDGVECGRSTGLCPLPLGVPRCVIHNKKMLERNFGNFEKKIILTTKTIPTMQRNKKTFKGQNIYIGICPQQTKRTVPLVSFEKPMCNTSARHMPLI